MGMIPINKFELVELIAAGTAGGNSQTKIMFQDLPQLRDKPIDSIEVYFSTEVPKTITQNTVADASQYAKGFLVLYLSDPDAPGSMGEFEKWIPLCAFHRVQNSANDPFVRDLYAFRGLMVQWPKCYINLSDPLNNTENVSFLFGVGYHNRNAK